MQNFNRRSRSVPMVIMAQIKAPRIVAIIIHVDRTHSLTHLHQHSYNHVVRNTGRLRLDRIWNRIFILKILEETGANWSTRIKKPDKYVASMCFVTERFTQSMGWGFFPRAVRSSRGMNK